MHVMVSSDEFISMMWSLWSFFRSCEDRIGLVVHDDGTLRDEHYGIIRRQYPGSRVISADMASTLLSERLRDHPRCAKLRSTRHLSRKVFDFFLFADADRILFADSDIVYYRSPLEVIRWPTGVADMPHVFIEDVWTNYLIPVEEIKQRHGINIPPRINIGFGSMARSAFDLNFIESVLEDERLVAAPFLYAQTLVAMLAARQGVSVLGGPYRMTLKAGIDGFTLKHYTRVIRHMMYTEGIQYLSSQTTMGSV
jgi:hypothetical protein